MTYRALYARQFHEQLMEIGETKGRRSSDSASFQVHTGCTPAAKSA